MDLCADKVISQRKNCSLMDHSKEEQTEIKQNLLKSKATSDYRGKVQEEMCVCKACT